MNLRIVRDAIARSDLAALAARQFGDIVKAVVDVDRGIMAVGGDLWGVNLYPAESGEEWIECDSVINIRPSQANRSRGVEDGSLRQRIRGVVEHLVSG